MLRILVIEDERKIAAVLDLVVLDQMTRFRKKVDTQGAPRLIHTIRGVGFALHEGEP